MDQPRHSAGKRSEQRGRFWRAQDPEQSRTGLLERDHREAQVQLDGALTTGWTRVATHSDGGTASQEFRPAPQGPRVERLLVHGTLDDGEAVTLVGGHTTHRTSGPFDLLAGGRQLVSARYALIGAHVPGEQATFVAARLRFAHLDEWANLRSLSVQDGQAGDVHLLRRPPPPRCARTGEGVEVGLAQSVSWRQEPSARGAALELEACVTLARLPGLTVDEVWARCVRPLSTLLTLAVGRPGPPVAVTLLEEGQRWHVDLVHLDMGLDDQPTITHEQMLAPYGALVLEHLTSWLDAQSLVGLVGALTAGVQDVSGSTLENQTLQLASACEGLHRRLHDDVAELDKLTRKSLRHTAANAVPPEHRQLVLDALQHVGHTSFRSRLRQLVADVEAQAVAGLTGNREVWLQGAVAVRNELAHRLPDPDETPESRGDRYYCLRMAMYWLLVARLLLASGLDAGVLRDRLSQDRRFRYWRDELASNLWPEVYRPEAQVDGGDGRVAP